MIRRPADHLDQAPRRLLALVALAAVSLPASPALACGGECATGSIAALPGVLGVIALVAGARWLTAFVRRRSLARALGRFDHA